MKRLILAAALFAAVAAFEAGAQPMGMPGHPPMGGQVPSAELLATSDLTPAQQAEVRRILTQKRDALDAAASKIHTQMQALHKQMREEHDRIETQTSDQLRKALGEDAYKKYAEWSLRHEPHHTMMEFDGPMMHGMHMHGPHGGTDGPPPGAGKPDADGE